jgi:hypothetical protein
MFQSDHFSYSPSVALLGLGLHWIIISMTLSKFLESIDTDRRLCETPSLLVSGFGLSNFIDCGNFILSSRMTISFAPLSSVAVFRESNDGGTSADDTDAADGPV